ncbi:solute carrier family 12 member 8 isoform X4 [Balaenoptera ricei]|uniref:solute carrier family 12 member 8 isoform X4 n=1 Tax=Balaenoptera ricei TaxID=2746895 RepID=UPI0028BD1783|nr:solute carrier family 12 member 8 isoform X4 [Balaenoptera ricei]
MAQMSQVQELFHEAAQQEALAQPQPWWKIQLFIWEPVLFGTWDGVFTSCMINIFGVVLFLRTGWLVGNTGVLMGVFLVSFVALVALVTVLSGIGVGEHCDVGTGGVYSMIAAVLGGQTGGAIGLLYVFGQCVAGAMYITGFAESISDLLSLRNLWAVRGVSVAVLLALLGINLAGVKWIIRLQLLLLLLLAVSTLDFVVGSFTHLDPEHGFIGYSPELLRNNTLPDYSPGESFFTVFGVFFPAATGVMAGFNMGGDLREPAASIPLGSLAAVGISWFLYIVFVLLLGAICTRGALRYDFLIAEKVSLVGFLFLLGLYISSLASCMGGLYGAPRILQCIAQEKVIPALACLGQGKGPSKTPVAAICLTSLVTMAFVLVGQVNVLAPIVTINFMLTYIAVDYSYFSLSMGACSLPQVPESVPGEGLGAPHCSEHLLLEKAPSCGSEGVAWNLSEGTLLEFTKDMDQLLQLTRKLESSQPGGGESHGIPENEKGKTKKATKQTLQESFLLDRRSPASFPPEGSDGWPTASWEGQGPHGNMASSRSEGARPGGACGGQLIPEPSNQPRPSREANMNETSFSFQEKWRCVLTNCLARTQCVLSLEGESPKPGRREWRERRCALGAQLFFAPSDL